MGEKNIVLFVDDEPHILSAIRRATTDEAFVSLFASSGREALEIIRQRKVSVIVSDMRMPGMDGLTLLKTVRETDPKIVRIVLSAYTQLYQVLAVVNQAGIFQFISKPWQMEEELLVVVRQAIERFNLEAELDQLREGLAQKNQAYLNIFREMEQRFANEKKDLANLKNANHWIFSFWKKHLGLIAGIPPEERAAIDGYVDFIEAVQGLYLDILPAVPETKTMSKTINDIIKACADKIAVNADPDSAVKLSGYHSILLTALRVITELVAPAGGEQVSCAMTVEAQENEKKYLVAFTFGPEFLKLSPGNWNKAKIGGLLLNEIGRIYGINIAVDEKDATLRLMWRAEGSE